MPQYKSNSLLQISRHNFETLQNTHHLSTKSRAKQHSFIPAGGTNIAAHSVIKWHAPLKQYSRIIEEKLL